MRLRARWSRIFLAQSGREKIVNLAYPAAFIPAGCASGVADVAFVTPALTIVATRASKRPRYVRGVN